MQGKGQSSSTFSSSIYWPARLAVTLWPAHIARHQGWCPQKFGGLVELIRTYLSVTKIVKTRKTLLTRTTSITCYFPAKTGFDGIRKDRQKKSRY